jgi:hypothetical protein
MLNVRYAFKKCLIWIDHCVNLIVEKKRERKLTNFTFNDRILQKLACRSNFLSWWSCSTLILSAKSNHNAKHSFRFCQVVILFSLRCNLVRFTLPINNALVFNTNFGYLIRETLRTVIFFNKKILLIIIRREIKKIKRLV